MSKKPKNNPNPDFPEFYAEFREFTGKFNEFKTNTEKHLDSIDGKIDEIQKKGICTYHEHVIKELNELGNQYKVNGDKINELEKQDIRVETKLNKRQEVQLNVTTFGAAIVYIWKIIEVLFY